MAAPGVRLIRPVQFDRFLHATIGRERNSMDLSVLSLLARVGHDPWAEAMRLTELPRAAAVDSLAATIACLLGEGRPRAHPRAVALRLVLLLPSKDHPAPGIPAAGRRQGGGVNGPMLAGAMLGATLALGLLIGAAVWGNFHAGPSAAIVEPSTGATITSRPLPIEQPGHRRADPKRPVQMRPVIVRLA